MVRDTEITNKNSAGSKTSSTPTTEQEVAQVTTREISPLESATLPDKPFICTSLGRMFLEETILDQTMEMGAHKARMVNHFSVDASGVIRTDIVEDVCASFQQFPKGSAERTELMESLVSGLSIDRGRAITRGEILKGRLNEVSEFDEGISRAAEESLVTLLKRNILTASEVTSLFQRDDYPAMKA